MSGGIIGWLVGFLDGSTGKYTFRATTFRSDTFASGHWCGLGVDFLPYDEEYMFRAAKVMAQQVDEYAALESRQSSQYTASRRASSSFIQK